MRTQIMDVNGKLRKAYVPKDKIEIGRVWKPEDWTKEMEEHKLNRVGWLNDAILNVDEALEKKEMSEYQRVMLLFYKDQLRVDLREDKQRLKYKGLIPKHIDERAVRRASESFSKYRRWGDKFFDQLREDIDVHFWGNVIVDQSSGGGKLA